MRHRKHVAVKIELIPAPRRDIAKQARPIHMPNDVSYRDFGSTGLIRIKARPLGFCQKAIGFY